jgi:hypothetical protein
VECIMKSFMVPQAVRIWIYTSEDHSNVAI